jgi:hypothetical protein
LDTKFEPNLSATHQQIRNQIEQQEKQREQEREAVQKYLASPHPRSPSPPPMDWIVGPPEQAPGQKLKNKNYNYLMIEPITFLL